MREDSEKRTFDSIGNLACAFIDFVVLCKIIEM